LYCLKIVLDIEKSFGRKRTIKYGPRTLDIDIIYYGKVTLKHPDLILPHPEMSKRKFVLVPLCEISASFVHPELKKSNQELLELCSDDLEVKRYQQ
ncbi:MAG TPA: 2-amino-4-hydroxy-6-hydroxymethyldihydropteridine diphosphokinase, partial [Bacteroidia bacterium]